MLSSLPFIYKENLFHWGTMEKVNINKAGTSLEGNSLSLSDCPKEWVKILNLSINDKLFSFKKKSGLFVDILQLLKSDKYKKEKDLLINEAVKESLLQKKIIFNVCFYDSESDENRFMVFENYEEAFTESNDGEYEILQEERYIATENLLKSIGINKNLGIMSGEEYGCIEVLKRNTDIDGIFWDYTNDVNIYSLPIYCIFNTKVDEWSYRQES